jgi:hypothetical protein
LAEFGRIRRFLRRGFRRIVRILWRFSGGKGYQGIGIRDSLFVMYEKFYDIMTLHVKGRQGWDGDGFHSH